jgi:hypothetical protein
MKLLAVGVCIAALIGYVTFSSKGDGTHAVPLVSASLPVTAFSGPFERSAALCKDEKKYMCIGLAHDGPVKKLVPHWSTFEMIKELNGWKDSEVTPETEIPAYSMIVFMLADSDK